MGSIDGGVREFYAGKSVFLTGATGYLGKVTLEKLLYSCPEMDKVYLLVRPKQGLTVTDRLAELTSSPAFVRLKRERPNFADKIELISGDIGAEGLGLSPKDVQTLKNEISVIIHNAATVRFTEPLKDAVRINVIGLRQMAQLGQQMKKLEGFVHVSTAYSNCPRPEINECIYPQRMTPNQLIDSLSWMTDKEVASLTPTILEKYPNTYTFTKGLAENLLDQEKGDMPTAILRPSIIVSSLAEPVPGWIDGLTGANGLYALQGLGTLRKMHGFNHQIADLVPVDLVANGSIVAGWKLAMEKPKQTMVVNMTSGQLKPIYWRDVYKYGAEYQYKYPSKSVLRPPVTNMYTERFYYQTVRGLWKFAASVEYFTCGEWKFANNNTVALSAKMSPTERKVFNCDMKTVDWKSFAKDWWQGTKQYCWREDPKFQDQYTRRFKGIYFRSRLIWVSCASLVVFAVAQKAQPFDAPYQTSSQSSTTSGYSDAIVTKGTRLFDWLVPARRSNLE